MSDDYKKQAAHAALSEIRSGMRIGLGTGSTARHFVDALGGMVADGFECICVPTSVATENQARVLGIPLADLDELKSLDITIDGADEIDGGMRLIKGGGGALLREKIVAAASSRMVVIADNSKMVETLGKFPLPIEVNRFAFDVSLDLIRAVAARHGAEGEVVQRQSSEGSAFVTDGDHLIADAFFGRISDAEALSRDLLDIPGVVQHGLFLGLCDRAYIAGPEGLKTLGA